MKRNAFWAATTLVAGIALDVAAQDPVRQLQDCRVIPNMASRLFCYDRTVDGLTAGAIAAAPPIAPPQVAPPQIAPSAAAPVAGTPRAAAPVAAPTAPLRTPPPQAAQPLSTPPQTTPQRTAAVPTPTPQFGDDSLPAERRRATNAVSADEMAGKVSTIKRDRYGNSVIALENGQVWRQTDGPNFSVPPGTGVVVKKGILGAYFMTVAEGNRTIRVKRLE